MHRKGLQKFIAVTRRPLYTNTKPLYKVSKVTHAALNRTVSIYCYTVTCRKGSALAMMMIIL